MLGAYLINLITPDAALTSSSEDAAYPVENLYDRQAANVFRGTSTSTLSVLVDFGAITQVNSIALINHNLTASATLSLKGGATASPTTVVATPIYREHDLWIGFNPASYRYWLLEISDSNLAELQIGQLVLGMKIAFPRARRIGQGYKPMTGRANISGETYAGVLWNYHLFQRQTFNPSFRIGSSSEFSALAALDQAVFGNLWPFVWIPDITDDVCYYVRKEETFEPGELDRIAGGELVHDYQMTLIEESRGLEIQI